MTVNTFVILCIFLYIIFVMGDRKLEYSIRDICIRQIRSFDIINKKNCISSAYTKDKLLFWKKTKI